MPSSHIQKIIRNEKEIWIIDYRGLKPEEMMKVATESRQNISADNKPALVLTLLDDKTYVTPAFMRHAEKETAEIIHLVEKVVFVGLSPIKQTILRGYNFFFKRSFKAFDSEEAAIIYLIDKKLLIRNIQNNS